MNTGTTFAPRPRRVDGLVVVSDTPDLPGWVRDWSRRAGRQMRIHQAQVRAPGHGPTPPGLLAAISAWATDPVLVVPAESADTLLRQVTAALHDLPDDEPVLAAAADTARRVGGPLVLTHGLLRRIQRRTPVRSGPRSPRTRRRGTTAGCRGLVARTALNHATCPVLIVPR
jgi:hypothetical protein